MNVYILLPNDGEFEFEAELSFYAGSPGKLNGLPENCYPAEPDVAEFASHGPFHDMFDAVYTACWVYDCPMSEEDIQRLADRVTEETIDKFLENPPVYEPDPPDEDDFTGSDDWMDYVN